MLRLLTTCFRLLTSSHVYHLATNLMFVLCSTQYFLIAIICNAFSSLAGSTEEHASTNTTAGNLTSVSFLVLFSFFSLYPLSPIDTIWHHAYFRHHKFIKKC